MKVVCTPNLIVLTWSLSCGRESRGSVEPSVSDVDHSAGAGVRAFIGCRGRARYPLPHGRRHASMPEHAPPIWRSDRISRERETASEASLCRT